MDLKSYKELILWHRSSVFSYNGANNTSVSHLYLTTYGSTAENMIMLQKWFDQCFSLCLDTF